MVTLDVMFTGFATAAPNDYSRLGGATGPLEQALVIDVQILDLVADHAGSDAEVVRRRVDISLGPLEASVIRSRSKLVVSNLKLPEACASELSGICKVGGR